MQLLFWCFYIFQVFREEARRGQRFLFERDRSSRHPLPLPCWVLAQGLRPARNSPYSQCMHSPGRLTITIWVCVAKVHFSFELRPFLKCKGKNKNKSSNDSEHILILKRFSSWSQPRSTAHWWPTLESLVIMRRGNRSSYSSTRCQMLGSLHQFRHPHISTPITSAICQVWSLM